MDVLLKRAVSIQYVFIGYLESGVVTNCMS